MTASGLKQSSLKKQVIQVEPSPPVQAQVSPKTVRFIDDFAGGGPMVFRQPDTENDDADTTDVRNSLPKGGKFLLGDGTGN